LNNLKDILKSYGKYEIIVVDDDSPDLTWKIVEDYSSRDEKIKIIRRKKDKGLSKAVIEGFRKARGDILGVMDADLSHDHKILPRMISAVRDNNYDLVVGSRRVPGGGAEKWPWYRKISSDFATFAAKCILNLDFSDPMSGYFIIKKEVFERVSHKIDPRGYKILLEIYVRSHPQKVKEVPYIFRDRTQGHSKMSLKIMLEYFQMLLKLRFK
jgi:dolichol-phosphate mannosyltransferase